MISEVNKERPVVRGKPNFIGPFFRWSVNYNTTSQGTLTRFVVFSSGRRQTVKEYLWLKIVWDQLTTKEFELFLSLPGILENTKIVGFLRAKLINPKKLRERLNLFETLMGDRPSSRERYKGLKRLRIEIRKETIQLRKVTKYSGYVRNISSIGRGHRGSGKPEPTGNFLFADENQIDWFEILTVGDLTLLGKSVNLP
jgi:hypothetical protein